MMLLATLLHGADVVKLRRPANIKSFRSPLSASTTTTGEGAGESRQQQQSFSGDGLLRLVANVRDELIDAVEGFTLAESNAERLDHAFDVVKRHKGTIGLGLGAWFLKSRVLKAASANARASTAFNSARAAEVAKWGTRRSTGL
jgi:hypothetical protein